MSNSKNCNFTAFLFTSKGEKNKGLLLHGAALCCALISLPKPINIFPFKERKIYRERRPTYVSKGILKEALKREKNKVADETRHHVIFFPISESVLLLLFFCR